MPTMTDDRPFCPSCGREPVPVLRTRGFTIEKDGAPEPRILVFAGAGASVAVSKDYPTTELFFQRLPENITKDDVFVLLQAYLREERKLRTIDIEALLWALQEARTTYKNVLQDSSSSYLLTHGANRFSINRGHVVHPLQTLLPHLEGLESAINAQIYDHYSREPVAEDALDTTWVPLLQHLTGVYRHVDIFTTNYDCVLEHVITETKLPIDTGRRGTTYPRLELDVWKNEKRMSTQLLTKLHGSVHWRWRGGRKSPERKISVGDPSYSGAHETHVVIYPGFKGVPEEEPFRTFHGHFADCVREASGVVFIGFAFRDEYLNTLLASELRKDVVLVAVDPKPEIWSTTEPSWARGMTHIPKPFGLEAIDDVLNALCAIVRPMRAKDGESAIAATSDTADGPTNKSTV